MAGTGVGKFSSTAGSNTSNLTVNFAENMAPSNVNNAARELMGHIRDMYEQLGDGYFEFGDGDGEYTVARSDADTITITSSADISSVYFAGRKIRITDGGANVVEGTIASSSHTSTTQTVNLTGISLASGTPTKVELGVDTAAFGGRLILDDDGDTYIEAVTDDTIDIYVAGAKDFVITANTFTAESGSTIAAQALTATSVTVSTAVDINGVADALILDADADTTISAPTDDQIDIEIAGADDFQFVANQFKVLSGSSVSFATDSIAYFGDGNNLQISSDGTNAKIAESGGSGNLVLSGQTVRLEKSDGEIMLEATNDAGVDIRHNNVKKLETTATGIDITGAFTATDGCTITVDDNSDTLRLISTDADGAAGPVLNLVRDSASPADNDSIGRIYFSADNDAGQEENYIRIKASIIDASDGTEDAQLRFSRLINGGDQDILSLLTSETVFNNDSKDVDFRVESDGNANMFKVDAGNNAIGIGSDPISNSMLHIKQAASGQSSVSANSEELIIEDDDNCGMTILSGTGNTGTISFGDSNDDNIGQVQYHHSEDSLKFVVNTTEKMRILSGGQISTGGDTSPDVGSGGLTLNQGDNDDNIFTLKSADVAHGITGAADTDTYFNIAKTAANEGGVRITSFSETNTDVLRMFGIGTGEQDGESTSHGAAVEIIGAKKNGTGIADLSGDGNLFACRQYSGTTALIIKGDGEIFSNQSATVGTFDTYEDAQLVRAYDLNHMQGVINSKFDKFVQYNKDDLQKAKLIGTDDDNNATSMVNITGMQRLHNGAIWQQYEKTERLANAVYELAKAAVGEDKANEILKQNEIKLLN
jgi:hypothetical protein